MGSIEALRGKVVYLDANVFIYGLEAELSPWNSIADVLLRALGRAEFAGVTSELTLAECLVKPLQTGSGDSVQLYLDTIRPRAELTVMPVSREVLIEAARIRAGSANKLADAIHVASSRAAGCEVFVTNDQRLRGSAALNCILLSELAAS